MASQVPGAAGEVLLLPGLAGVQGCAFETPTVVLAQSLGGMEDIPHGEAAGVCGATIVGWGGVCVGGVEGTAFHCLIAAGPAHVSERWWWCLGVGLGLLQGGDYLLPS